MYYGPGEFFLLPRIVPYNAARPSTPEKMAWLENISEAYLKGRIPEDASGLSICFLFSLGEADLASLLVLFFFFMESVLFEM